LAVLLFIGTGIVGVDGFAEFAPPWTRLMLGCVGVGLSGLSISFKSIVKDLSGKSKQRYDGIVQKYRGKIEERQKEQKEQEEQEYE